MPFTNGIGRIREWDLFVVGPEHMPGSSLTAGPSALTVIRSAATSFASFTKQMREREHQNLLLKHAVF
jgi:hypothetical protein